MHFLALVVRDVEDDRLLGNHAVGLRSAVRRKRLNLPAGHLHLRMLQAHVALEQSAFRSHGVISRENLRELRLGGGFGRSSGAGLAPNASSGQIRWPALA